MAKVVANNFRGNSTNVNPRYLLSDFVPTVSVTNSDGTTVNTLEIFSSNMIKGIEALSVLGLDKYMGQPITTIAFRRYRNTTCYWMIMLASKQIHPLLLQTGDLIYLPDIDAIRKAPTQQPTVGARIPVFTTI